MRAGSGDGAEGKMELRMLVHTAEHTQRHAGQIITTAKIVKALAPQ